MIGTALNLSLPALSDPLAVAIAKIRDALSAIDVTIADKATQGAIEITAPFDLGGNTLDNAGQVKLVSGIVPSTPGSLYYTGNELWMVTAAGAVKITNAGALNIAATGGFIGDYGQSGVPAGASYSVSTAQYRFFSDSGSGAYAATVSANHKLINAGGFSVTHAPNAAMAASYTAIWPVSLPASASVVQLDNLGNITASPAGAVSCGALTCTTSVSSGDNFHTFERSGSVPLTPAQEIFWCGYAPQNLGELSYVIKTDNGGTWRWTSQPHPMWGLRNGDRIVKVRYVLPSTVAGTYTFTLGKQGAGAQTVVETWTVAGGSAVDATRTLVSPGTIADGENWFISILGPDSATDVLSFVGVRWTHPV